jgi:5-methyltetrahydropteroyltriglutamate--homocysteine methyltransferase
MAKKLYRTDQVGSLLRPAQLLDARDAHEAGRIGDDKLNQIIDASIVDALKRQQDIGVEIYTDGEMRRDAWQTNVAHAVEGFDPKYPVMELPGPDGTVTKLEMHTQIINGKIRRKGRIAQEDAVFLRQHAPGSFKITMPSPNYVARMGSRPGITDKAYPVYADLLGDVTNIVRDEMKALVDDGASYVQLDEGFVYYLSEILQKQVVVADLEKALLADIAAENACYDAVRDRITVAMHVCRGSRISWMHGAKGYDWLAERLFSALNVDRFLLEYDLNYEDGFEPLRFLPKGKVAVLGVISSKEPRVESADEIARRIEAAAKFCPLDQLALTTQCGFQAAADRDGAHIGYDEQWRKLALMMTVARKVWG